MSRENQRKFSITEKHREVAKLLWDGDLTVEQIAKQCRIAPSTIYEWKLKLEFQAILTEIDETYRLNARRKAIRLSDKAIDTLEKLLGQRREKTVDTARKSAVDLLNVGEVKRLDEETGGAKSIIIIRDGNGNKT